MTENERDSSLSGSQSETSSCSSYLQFPPDDRKNSEENLMHCKERCDGTDRNDADLVLNFRPGSISYRGTSEEDEEETNGKLSAVTEPPVNPPNVTGRSNNSYTWDDKELNRILQERVKFLHKTIIQLGEQLSAEIALWKKEKEEFQLLRERCDNFALEEATAAACAAAAAYAAESPLSDKIGDVVDISSDQALRELAILEYEKELAKYQGAYSFAQADARYNARRRLIAKAYEQKIIEVERLCNEELEKIQRNANNLLPLKEMALRWQSSLYDRGDLKNEHPVAKEFTDKFSACRSLDAEVNMTPELIAGKSKADETTKRPSL